MVKKAIAVPRSGDWQPLVTQAIGCMTSAWARLTADVDEVDATLILEKEIKVVEGI